MHCRQDCWRQLRPQWPACQRGATHAHAGGFQPLCHQDSTRRQLASFRIPYIEDLINMEPCTLWGKFLLREREEHASSGPQAKARMWQQPGTLNSESTMQPLLMTSLSGRSSNPMWHPMVNSSWLPCGEVTFTEDMVLSAAWTQQNRTSRRREKLQPRQTDSRGMQFPTNTNLWTLTLSWSSLSCT